MSRGSFAQKERSCRRAPGAALALLLALLMAPEMPALANGNTSADAPAQSAQPVKKDEPVKKSVRRAPVKRQPTKKQTVQKQSASKAAPKKATVSSLDRGVALMQQDRYTAALPWLRRAIQENRRSAAAWYWYGMYHEKTGKFYEAQYFYTKAVECDPTFEPLSRVVVYPNDGEKTPLWDPKRPARVYPVPTNNQGVATIPPDAPQSRKLPTRPEGDPSLPKVPVYMPPESDSRPADGDPWHPSMYVPPTMGSTLDADDDEPVYVPPAAQSDAAEPALLYRPGVGVVQQGYPQPQEITGGAPVYQPPLPPQPQQNGQAIQPAPQQQKAQPKATATATAKKSTSKKQPAKKQPAKKQSAPNAASGKGVKAAPAQQKTPTKTPKAPAPEPEVKRAPELPPPEPVTVPDTRPAPTPPAASSPQVAPHPVQPEFLPPVGQGGQNAQQEPSALPPVGQNADGERSEIE